MNLLIATAVLPTIILLNYINKKDEYEQEPKSLLIILFILGILGVFITLVLTNFLSFFIDCTYLSESSTTLDKLINSFLVVALVEEGIKYLFVYTVTWKNKNFNHVFDAIVYSVYVSLGFATLENVLYAFNYGFATAILRGIISVPAHAFFAVFMGYYLSLAKLAKLKKNQNGYRVSILKSILYPIVIHGTFDFCLEIKTIPATILFFVLVFILYNTAFKKIKQFSEIKEMF